MPHVMVDLSAQYPYGTWSSNPTALLSQNSHATGPNRYLGIHHVSNSCRLSSHLKRGLPTGQRRYHIVLGHIGVRACIIHTNHTVNPRFTQTHGGVLLSSPDCWNTGWKLSRPSEDPKLRELLDIEGGWNISIYQARLYAPLLVFETFENSKLPAWYHGRSGMTLNVWAVGTASTTFTLKNASQESQ